MKLLDKLVLKDLLPMFVIGIGLFSSVWYVAGPLLKASQYLEQGFAWFIVLHFLALSIPVVLSFTFPMAMVLCVLTGFGRISGDSEAVALFAGGIPFSRIVATAAVLGLIASFVGFYINNDIATSASRQIADMQQNVFKQVQSDQPIQLPPITKDNHLLATVLVEGGVDARSGILHGVTITSYDLKGHPTTVIYAAVAKYAGDTHFQLRDADVTVLGPSAFYSHTPYLTTSAIDATPEMIAFMKADTSTLSFSELRRQAKILRAGGAANAQSARKAELAMWRIVALPLASLVFAAIGSPLGLKPQRTSKLTGWVLAIVIIFGYYVLMMMTGNMSDGGTLPPIAAAFAPDVIGLIVGAVLVFRAAT